MAPLDVVAQVEAQVEVVLGIAAEVVLPEVVVDILVAAECLTVSFWISICVSTLQVARVHSPCSGAVEILKLGTVYFFARSSSDSESAVQQPENYLIFAGPRKWYIFF